MITDHPSPAHPVARTRTTSAGAWAIVLGIAAVLLLLRLPAATAMAETVLSEQVSALDDPTMAGMAISMGAVGALVLQLCILLLLAALASVLERLLGPPAIGTRLRVGVAGIVYGALVLGQQAWALATGVVAVERSWLLWVVALAVAATAPAAFSEARSSWRAYLRAAVPGILIGGLLCLG